MTEDSSPRTLAPGAALLHIGLPKTGTTAVQAAADHLRGELLRQGVCYPGTSRNHGYEANALMGRTTALRAAGDIERWHRLTGELRSHPEAVGWVSYEQVVQARPDVARRFLDELGPDLHVVVTARTYVPMFASAWQQWIKDAGDAAFGAWLDGVLAARAGEADTPDWATGFWRRHDLPAIARVWADLLGPERVHVIVLDKRTPHLLFDAFEGLLGLTPGTLAAAPRDPLDNNRGLTTAEAELVQATNAVAARADERVERRDYFRLMKHGAIAAVMRDREPVAAEGLIVPPAKAVDLIAAEGEGAARELSRLGVDIIGDADLLGERPRGVPEELAPPHGALSVDLVATAVLGAMSSAMGEGLAFDARDRVALDLARDDGPRPSRMAAWAELARRAWPGVRS